MKRKTLRKGRGFETTVVNTIKRSTSGPGSEYMMVHGEELGDSDGPDC